MNSDALIYDITNERNGWHFMKNAQPDLYKPIEFPIWQTQNCRSIPIIYEGFYDGSCFYYMTFRGARQSFIHEWRYLGRNPQVYMEEPHDFYYPGNGRMTIIDKHLIYHLKLPN